MGDDARRRWFMPAVNPGFKVGDRVRELESMEVGHNGDTPEQWPVASDRRGKIIQLVERPLKIVVEWDDGPPPLVEHVSHYNIELESIIDSIGRLADDDHGR